MPNRIVLEKLVHEPTPFPYSLQICDEAKEELLFHIHPHCQITQNMGDALSYMIHEQEVALEQGDVLLINSNIPHACMAKEGARRRNLGFYPEMLEFNKFCRVYGSFLNVLYSNMYPYILLKKNDCDEMRITKILDEIFETQKRDYMAPDGVIHNRIMDLSILLIQWIVKTEKKDIHRISTVLYRSMEYIEQNRMEPIMMRDAARVAGLNPSYFSHCFKKNLGISFKQYLNRKRLEEAAVELTTTEHQISEIAFACGFGSVSSFYQNFAELYKLSPKKFRDLNMKKQT